MVVSMSESRDKNETSRFLGEGASFKAKLIGILEVSEARGDRMCQEALSDLKMAIRAAGEHKQRITINIAIEGLRLRDEKTGDSLYHHPVHKISFIAQDMTDSRAFGYIFGSPDTGHRFFGIKTDKAASQVVIAMRDLFQVVFALKKKEIELAKQHLDKSRYGVMSIFSDSSYSTTKHLASEGSSRTSSERKPGTSGAEGKTPSPAVADLVDLELELNSLQQGISQMERITPSDPFGSKDDPFGDSFTSYPPKPILPPPPSGKDRTSRTSDSSSLFSPKTPHTAGSHDPNSITDTALHSSGNFNFSTDSAFDDGLSGDWFLVGGAERALDDFSSGTGDASLTKDQLHEIAKQEILSQFDVFTELDPLGTGKSKPYIDKKDFFQELKNPPKKVLNQLVGERPPQDTQLFPSNFEQSAGKSINGSYAADPFGEDPFDKTDPFAEADFPNDPFDTTEFYGFNQSLTSSAKPERQSPKLHQPSIDAQFPNRIAEFHENRSLDMSSEPDIAPEPPPRPALNLFHIKPPPLPPKKQEFAIKPPPRPPHSEEARSDYLETYGTTVTTTEVPRKIVKAELNPPLPAPVRKSKNGVKPERPLKNFTEQQSSEEDYLTPVSLPKPKREYRSVGRNTGPLLEPPPQKSSRKSSPSGSASPSFFNESPSNTASQQLPEKHSSLDGLDITLSQLTLSGLNELATKLDIHPSQLSNMTLAQLTEYISHVIRSRPSEEAEPQANFANFNNFDELSRTSHDKYAVFRELFQEEIKQTKIDTEPEECRMEEEQMMCSISEDREQTSDNADRYAALRDIVETDIQPTVSYEEVKENNVSDVETEPQSTLEDIDEEKEPEDEETQIKNKTNNLYSDSPEITESKEEAVIAPSAKHVDKSEEFRTSADKIKSPIAAVMEEVVGVNNRLTSGSFSDAVSGSSPEGDNKRSTPDMMKKTAATTGESWAIFDQAKVPQRPNRDKRSEDGVSPWSSDSKEFGNGSPSTIDGNGSAMECRIRADSGSGGDRWARQREHSEWWDPSAEPQSHYPLAKRRSTDSYDDDGYDYYDRAPRRRKQTWSESVATGGQSSSSRDASPWEEEPKRREAKDTREYGREMWSSRYTDRHHSFDRRDRKHADSWDEEDDYEYDEEHLGRCHWPERHVRGVDERRVTPHVDRWTDEWSEDRRCRRRKDVEWDRRCCPDWEGEEPDRYGGSKWRDRKHDERYACRYNESVWENDHEDPRSVRYLSAKKNWKRPSSASEMERKSAERGHQGQYYMSTGGSDGERDKRHKTTRRSRSRDSQQSDGRKVESATILRPSHRPKSYQRTEESSFQKRVEACKLEPSLKRSSTLSRKKSPQVEETTNTFPRKGKQQQQPPPTTFASPEAVSFKFDEFQASKKSKSVKPRPVQRSPFEDDFSPQIESSVNVIREVENEEEVEDEDDEEEEEELELEEEEDDSFGENNFHKSNIRKKLNKNRFSGSFQGELSLKKSDSINIFARENDPFDDEFFSEEKTAGGKWMKNFEEDN